MSAIFNRLIETLIDRNKSVLNEDMSRPKHPDFDFKEDYTTNRKTGERSLEQVTMSLSGQTSSRMTTLIQKYKRVLAGKRKIEEIFKSLQTQLRDFRDSNVDDIDKSVKTIIETLGGYMITIAKHTTSEPKDVVNWEKAFQLLQEATNASQELVDGIIKKSTNAVPPVERASAISEPKIKDFKDIKEFVDATLLRSMADSYKAEPDKIEMMKFIRDVRILINDFKQKYGSIFIELHSVVNELKTVDAA